MPERPCLELGCPETVRSGRCPKHEREHRDRRAAAKRATPAKQVYDDPRWLRARARAIARAGGRCQALDGERCPARSGLHGHHDYPGGVERMLADGIDPFDERRIVVLCDTHHGRLEAWLRAQGRRNHSIRR